MKEFWINKDGTRMLETERNPCMCCPDSYDKTEQHVRNKRLLTWHIGPYTRENFLKMMKQNGFEKLE